MKKIIRPLFYVFLTIVFSSPLMLRAEDPAPEAVEANPQVKSLLVEALQLYNDHQYVRSLDLFKQVQSLDPKNATADEYIKSTKQRILEWEMQGNELDKPKAESANWDSLTKNKGNPTDTLTNAKDIIAARRSLVEKMRNRSSNMDNIVQIHDTPKGLDVVLFHDQLFLPGLQTLRDESLPVLSNVADLLRKGGDRDVTIQSAAHSDSTDPFMLYPEFSLPAADPSLPQVKPSDSAIMFQDIEATRAFILFTYIAQKSMAKTANAGAE